MESVYPVSMEKLDQGYGYILYESQLKDEGPLETLRLWGANDRANIFVDEIPTVTLYDRELLDEIKIVIEAHRFADFGQGKLCVCQ